MKQDILIGCLISVKQVTSNHALMINDNKLYEKEVPWIREVCLENLRGKCFNW